MGTQNVPDLILRRVTVKGCNLKKKIENYQTWPECRSSGTIYVKKKYVKFNQIFLLRE